MLGCIFRILKHSLNVSGFLCGFAYLKLRKENTGDVAPRSKNYGVICGEQHVTHFLLVARSHVA